MKLINKLLPKKLIPSVSEPLQDDEILKIDHLTMKFGGLTAVNDVSFTVKRGELFGLIGPNGAGKTTVFNCITQFYKPTSGDIYFNGSNLKTINLNGVKVHDIVKHGIIRTFQNVELVWELTVLDNLLVTHTTNYKAIIAGSFLHLPHIKKQDKLLKEKALNILAMLGLYFYKDRSPYGLPYGVLKKIELARTLMVDPQLIILDEPAAGLNESETKELADTIKLIAQTYETTIFLVEHDMSLVMSICDRIAAINFGSLIGLGTPKETQENEAVRVAYLGSD